MGKKTYSFELKNFVYLNLCGYYKFFSLVDAAYPGIQLPLLESIRCHSTDEYLIYGIEEEV